MNKIFKLKV